MFRFYKWSDGRHQIEIEGSSFYFVDRYVIALRIKSEQDLFIRKVHPASPFIDVFNQLSNVYKTQPIEDQEFDKMVERAYRKALCNGFRRYAFKKITKGE